MKWIRATLTFISDSEDQLFILWNPWVVSISHHTCFKRHIANSLCISVIEDTQTYSIKHPKEPLLTKKGASSSWTILLLKLTRDAWEQCQHRLVSWRFWLVICRLLNLFRRPHTCWRMFVFKGWAIFRACQANTNYLQVWPNIYATRFISGLTSDICSIFGAEHFWV